MSDWVRQLIRQRLSASGVSAPADIAGAFRQLALPAPGIEQMLADIERGRQ